MPPNATEEIRAFGAAVRQLRLDRGLTQEAVSFEGGLGRKYLGQLERGELVPRLASIVGVGQGLEMPSLPAFLRALADEIEAQARASRRPSPAG